jgi:DNA adenine methylase
MRCVPSESKRYIEPFAGSACLFFALRPASAVLGDLNEQLIETYSVVRHHPRKVARALGQWKNTKRLYYQLRRTSPNDLDSIERAARFIYLNRYCFNGVYRTNRQGDFNVPRGSRTGHVPSEQMLYRCSIALRNTTFCAGDFEACLRTVRQDDFVYLDPPYAQTDRPTHGEYGYDGFGRSDIDRLVDCLKRIDRAGAVFLLSYCDTPVLAAKLNRKWACRRLSVHRHIAGFAEHRLSVTELLISNRSF